MKPTESIWEREFDKEFPDPMTQKYEEGFALYCSFCSKKGREEVKSFFRSHLQDIIKELEGMKVDFDAGGWNEALTEAIKIIKKRI